MNRLTLPHFGGKGHYMKCSEQFACNGECGDCDELDKIVEKLAEYEDREEKKIKTNADRIRDMTDKELGRFLAEVENRRSAAGGGAIWNGAAHAFEWLRQPVKED